MQFPQMVYRYPGSEPLQDGGYSTRIVDDAEGLDDALADGWHETPAEARKAGEQKPEPVTPVKVDEPTDERTREELEAEAHALDLKFDGRFSDKRLAAMIADAKREAAL